MSEQDSSQERTEEPTPKRQQQAKEKGQIARSKELTTAVVVLVGAVTLVAMINVFAGNMFEILKTSFTIDRESIYQAGYPAQALAAAITDGLVLLLPFFAIIYLASLGASSMLGGLNVNFSTLEFKFDRMDPIQGIKRIFSMRALMELMKALAKFLLIGTCAITLLSLQYETLLSLSQQETISAISEAISVLGWSFLILSLPLLLIAMIDVPFQLWQNAQKLKMTHQEIKDEMKDTEGRPEVKQKIRQLQHQLSRGRMMEEVPRADVVITNPTHYAIALVYDMNAPGAPKVVARGLDFLALEIQRVAKANDVPTLEIPPLARSIYYTTDLDQEIRMELYIAVAQVLAYVYQLKTSKPGDRPTPPTDLEIPDDFKF